MSRTFEKIETPWTDENNIRIEDSGKDARVLQQQIDEMQCQIDEMQEDINMLKQVLLPKR